MKQCHMSAVVTDIVMADDGDADDVQWFNVHLKAE